MKTILKKLDIALDILVPLSLIIVTIPIVFPILQRLTDFWLDIPFLSKFFDKSQRAFFLIPIVLYSVSLTIKHIRAFSHQERRSLAWLIALLGAEAGIIISCLIYFTTRIDAFLLNVPSFSHISTSVTQAIWKILTENTPILSYSNS